MLSIILAALPILGKLIPDGKTADIVAAGTKVAQEVFGTTDEKEIVAKMESNPALAEQFKAKLAADTAALIQETEQFRIQVEDVQNARITETGSWAKPVIAATVIGAFVTLCILLVIRPVTMDQTQIIVLNILLGTLAGSFVTVVSYYFGSSAGSSEKDRTIGKMSAENTSAAAKVAAKVVEVAKR